MSKTKIMVVEDNRIVAEDIKNNLVEMGYDVSAIATSGRQALDAVKSQIPDIALMDIRLGKGMNGIETATQLWEKYNIPIIYLTAHADAETIASAKVTEPYAYLVKPFDVEELQSAVEIAMYKHKMERKVRESEQWFFTTLKSIGDGVIATDWQGHVKFMNPVAERMTGWSQAEAMARPLHEVFHIINEYSRKRCENPAKKVIDTGQIIGLANHTILISRDGTEIPIKDSGAPIVLNNEESIGVVLVFQDDTEAKNKQKLEKKLRQSQKMEAVGTLAGGIAHDFNNILASVIGYTELAMEDTNKTSPLYQNLNEIMVAGMRARDLVRQILVFSRHAESKQKRLSLNELVGEAVRLMRATIPTSIEIQEQITPKPLMIYANASKIHQILVNLCTNAFHALENNGGTMKVQIDEVEYNEHVNVQFAEILPGKYAMITVSDDGKGIDPQHLERIFDPYFTTKDQDKGTGLGLSIVNGIISSHKGYITVNSTPDKGSTFKVYLPIVNDQVDACGPSVVQEMPTGSGECLMVVDDEAAIAQVQKQNLERLGYEVEVCTSSYDALEKFVNEPAKFDMLITDMTMPKMTGEKLVQRFREIRPDLPVILCTGFSDKIDRQKCAELKINQFLMKPIKKGNLARAIRNAFDGCSDSP